MQLARWEKQYEKTDELFKYREEEQVNNWQKLVLGSQSFQLKMDKIEKTFTLSTSLFYHMPK